MLRTLNFFFDFGQLLGSFSYTILALVPNPGQVPKFRPISCMLAINHSAFMEGRSFVNNVLLKSWSTVM